MSLEPTPADIAEAEAFPQPLEHNEGATRCCKPCRVASYLAGILRERERAAAVADRYARDANPEGNAQRPDYHDRVLGELVSGNIAHDIRRGPQ